MRLSFPLTAAGPPRIFTGFPKGKLFSPFVIESLAAGFNVGLVITHDLLGFNINCFTMD